MRVYELLVNILEVNMKKIVVVLLTVLVIWNIILSVELFNRPTGDQQINISQYNVDGFSTDLTVAAASSMSSIVSVKTENGFGSGVVVIADGQAVYIATNYHVIENASQIKVSLDNFDEFAAVVVGYDIKRDVAVLMIEPGYTVKALNYGDATLLKRGEFVLALGVQNGQELSKTVRLGLISDPKRSIEVNDNSGHYYLDMIESDADLSAGMSGGALINMSGELVGLCTMSQDNQSYALPANELKLIVNDIVISQNVSRYELGIKGYDVANMTNYQKIALGLDLQDVEGIYVSEVITGSLAESIGLKAGDCIMAINGSSITGYDRYLEAIYSFDEDLMISVLRNGVLIELKGAV